MSPQAKTQIVMIDDQVSYADAFGLALSLTDDLHLVAHAGDAQSGVDLVTELRPDLILCDYRLPDRQTGTLIARHLRDHGYSCPIVILTGFPAPQVRREAAELKDVHVLSKDLPVREVLAHLRGVVEGHVGDLDASRSTDSTSLSVGELEVLELLNQGHSPAQVAEALFLSLHAIRSRIKSIHRKLDVTSQPEAISVATRRGLLVPPQ